MKTKLIIAAMLLLFSASISQASSSKKMLFSRDAFGRLLSMPVKADQPAEDLPFDSEDIFRRSRQAQVSRIFDLSSMTKPEADVDDITIDLEAVYEEIMKNR